MSNTDDDEAATTSPFAAAVLGDRDSPLDFNGTAPDRNHAPEESDQAPSRNRAFFSFALCVCVVVLVMLYVLPLIVLLIWRRTRVPTNDAQTRNDTVVARSNHYHQEGAAGRGSVDDHEHQGTKDRRDKAIKSYILREAIVLHENHFVTDVAHDANECDDVSVSSGYDDCKERSVSETASVDQQLQSDFDGALPSKTKQLISIRDDDDCAICLSAYKVGDSVVGSSNPTCHHVYHDMCIEQWLLGGRQDDADRLLRCPCCRQPYLVRDDGDDNNNKGADDDDDGKNDNSDLEVGEGAPHDGLEFW